jgi:hypothetical protein
MHFTMPRDGKVHNTLYAVSMICRQAGDEWVLISQYEHSRLSGELARKIGNAMFAPPSPFGPVVHAIAEHDCGWEKIDRQPELNDRGQPAHVFESEVLTSLIAWQNSVDQVTAHDPYAVLLVSLHGMALANHAAAKQPEVEDEFTRQRAFRIRRFVHRQIEVQEQLRSALGMRTDLPLRSGLAEQGRADDEDLLRTNFFLLEFLDQLSLDLCFDSLKFQRIEILYPRAGEGPISARISSEADGGMKLNPWPFNVPSLELDLPARRIPKGPYRDAETLRRACESGKQCTVRVVLQAAGS